MNVGDVLGPCWSVRSMKCNRNLCLADEALDHARLPLGDEVVSASGIDEPHFNHATLDTVEVSLLERKCRTTFTSLGSLPDLSLQRFF